MSDEEYAFTPNEAKPEMIKLLESGLTPVLLGQPGAAKSAITRQVCDMLRLKMIDIRLSQCTPEDLLGLPMKDGNRARFIPFDTFPDESTPIPKGYDGWCIFLDEYTSAHRSVIAASYKITYDRMVGMLKLHPNVVVICAGNRDEDNAITNEIGTAAQSRMVHLEIKSDFESFIWNAARKGFDQRVISFLDMQPTLLNNFAPDHEDVTFACQRTWEFVSKYVKGRKVSDIDLRTLRGTIGTAASVPFYAFLKEEEHLPSFHSIETDPKGTMVPIEQGTQFATISMVVEKFTDKNFADVAKYLSRFPKEMQIVFFRSVVRKNPLMRRNKDFIKAAQQITEFLYDDDDVNLAA